MGKIILIRHGQSKLNIKKVYYGNLDPDLTETGIEQANKAKQILKNYDYDTIYSSDLKRALKTAQIINYNNVEIQTSKDLRELNFGIFEGLTYDEIVKKYPDEIIKSENDWKNYNYISGENVFQLQKRVINFLNKTIDFNKNNIIVSHWGVINTILSHYFSNELESYWKYSVNNGGIVILEFHDGYPIMKGFNIGG